MLTLMTIKKFHNFVTPGRSRPPTQYDGILISSRATLSDTLTAKNIGVLSIKHPKESVNP